MLEFKLEDAVKEEINKLEKQSKIISFIRTVVAIAAIVFIIVALSATDYIYYIVAGVLVLLFMAVVIFTAPVYRRLAKNKAKIACYDKHRKRRNGKYNSFLDNGYELMNKKNYKEADLDLFGKHSLFQYLNSGRTKPGREALQSALVNGSDINYGELAYRLAENEEAINLEATIQGFDGNAKSLDYEALVSTMGTRIPFKITYLLPLLSFIGMIVYGILSIAGIVNPYLLIVFLIVNFMFCKIFLGNEVFSLNSNAYSDLMDNYQDIIKTVENTDIDSELYKEIKKEMLDTIPAVKSTRGILGLLAFRNNFIFNLFSNLILIFDFWTILIYNFKTKEQKELINLFKATGKLEVALSFANIGIDNENYCIGEEADNISGNLMYHPLVKDCIANSFNLDGGVILTGSNMSGKTTFMRTIGICQTLYNAKALIPAKSYSSCKLPIHTSLRANDMLSEGVSTFYAEILRMQEINKAIKDGKCLILVDEIFKGTNATERILASNKVIDKLNDYKQLFIISTHDYELCDAKNITNYHFEEGYTEDNKITFDYTIKSGKSQTKNAIYLLKMANIIE